MSDIRISKEELNRLLQFIGYGNINSPLWFIGLEESLGPRPNNPDWSPLWELQTRSQWKTVMDVREAHESLQDHYWERRNYSNVWKVMAKLARGILHKQADWQDSSKAHAYVVEMLGQTDRETLLGEALPLPASSTKDWPYEEVIPSRKEYEQHLWPRRQQLWAKKISVHQPKYILCYGKTKWDKYKQLFRSIQWKTLIPKRIETSKFNSTTIYLTPFFGNGAYKKSDLETIIKHANG